MASAIPWTTLRALSFDVYGTLVDQSGGMVAAARSTSLNDNFPHDDAQLLQDLQKISGELEQKYPSMLKSDINAESLKLYASNLRLDETGIVSGNEIEKAAKDFGRKMGTYSVFDDSVEALKRLARHYKLIALSNVDHISFDETLSLQFGGNPFDACYIAEDIGSYKPSLQNFHYLIAHLDKDFGIGKEDLCHVAQSLHVDHAATKPMGIRSVWVDRYDVLGSSGRSVEDVQEEFGWKLRVRSLVEVADIVDRAFGVVRPPS